jgi:hypothetical protein
VTVAGLVAERSVRHLAIRAPTRSLAATGRVRLEDALRTATLPPGVGGGGGAGAGRLLLVRRLELELTDPRRPPSHLALAIERRMADLATTAVHGASPGAARASAVWFRDEAEPWRLVGAALAARIGGGVPVVDPRAWFWPLVLGATGPAASLRALLASAGRQMPGRLPRGMLLRSALGAVLAAGGSKALGAVCDRDEAARWAAVCGWRLAGSAEPGGGPERAARARGERVADPRLERLAGEAVGLWGKTDPRARLAVAVALAEARPALAAPALAGELLARVDGLLSRARRVDLPGLAPATDLDPTGDAPAPTSSTSPTSEDRIPRDVTSQARPGAPEADPSPSPDLAAPHPPHRLHPPIRKPETSAPADRPATLDWTPTGWGGLFFLLRPLDRLGLGDALAAEPELAADDLPRHLLEAIARQLGVPDDDGVWRALRPELAPGEATPEPSPRVAAAIPGWHRRLAAWLEERAGLDLARCTRRRGLVTASRTHLDLALPLSAMSATDLAVRRAGLDLDPGWVPWLARVVTFHYVDSLQWLEEVR